MGPEDASRKPRREDGTRSKRNESAMLTARDGTIHEQSITIHEQSINRETLSREASFRS